MEKQEQLTLAEEVVAAAVALLKTRGVQVVLAGRE
jgi:hypothetical protein